MRRRQPRRMRGMPRALGTASLLLGNTMASASSQRAIVLLGRVESSQCFAGFDRCPQAADSLWPDNFCCQKGSKCLNLAGNTTLLCCPDPYDCNTISTTSCLMDSYNADAHPDSPIKTTALTGVLPSCDDGNCCPFGYHCGAGKNGTLQCFLDTNQNAKPITTTPAKSSSTASNISGGTGTTIQTGTAQNSGVHVIPTSSPTTSTAPGQNNGASSGADTTPSATPQTSTKDTPPAVIAGAVSGAVLLVAAVAFVAFILFKRRHKKQEEETDALKLTRSTSSFGNIISNPIVTGDSTLIRSDFVRKSPGRSSVGSAFSVSTLVDEKGRRPSTPTAPGWTRMRPGVGTSAAGAAATAGRVPPIRKMGASRPTPRHSSIAYGVGGPDASMDGGGGNYHERDNRESPLPYPETPRQGHVDGQQREPSSISISVFADPRIATPQRNNGAGDGLTVPETPDMRRTSHMTTFSDMLRSADLGGIARGEPYVPPGSQQGTPASRRK